MARCPLCSERPAKRYCPAKETHICSVCCGTKREVEIECPAACPHLQVGRAYESEKRPVDPTLSARIQNLGEDFVRRFSWVMDVLCTEVLVEYRTSQWLLDSDVIEAYKALGQSFKTLDSGIYYDSLPENAVQRSLYSRLKGTLEKLMLPDAGRPTPLRASDVVNVMDFLVFVASANSNPRPKSRQYLHFLSSIAVSRDSSEGETSRLILP
jgi:hypothetical protein